MKRLVKKRKVLKMDLTPLIDVVFLLLIFFIVASEFKKNESILNLNLPSSSSEVKLEKQDVLIEISAQVLAYNAQKLDFDTLNTELSKLNPKTLINLKIDKSVKYERVVKTLDILNTLKLSNIILITNEK